MYTPTHLRTHYPGRDLLARLLGMVLTAALVFSLLLSAINPPTT